MKHAEHCGCSSTPTLNQTGELNDIAMALLLLDDVLLIPARTPAGRRAERPRRSPALPTRRSRPARAPIPPRPARAGRPRSGRRRCRPRCRRPRRRPAPRARRARAASPPRPGRRTPRRRRARPASRAGASARGPPAAPRRGTRPGRRWSAPRPSSSPFSGTARWRTARMPRATTRPTASTGWTTATGARASAATWSPVPGRRRQLPHDPLRLGSPAAATAGRSPTCCPPPPRAAARRRSRRAPRTARRAALRRRIPLPISTLLRRARVQPARRCRVRTRRAPFAAGHNASAGATPPPTSRSPHDGGPRRGGPGAAGVPGQDRLDRPCGRADHRGARRRRRARRLRRVVAPRLSGVALLRQSAGTTPSGRRACSGAFSRNSVTCAARRSRLSRRRPAGSASPSSSA